MAQEIVRGVYYLRKCVVVLRSPQGLPALLPLCGRMARAGIGCEVMLSEELPEKEPGLSEGILYLTDDPRVYDALAAAFAAGGEAAGCQPPALVYLHEGSRGGDFGGAQYALEEPEELEPEYLERVYRRCHDLPWEILSTKRCWLRETVEGDVEGFWKMYQSPGLTRYTEKLYPSPAAEREYIRKYRRLVYAFFEYGVWTVLCSATGQVIGRAGLSAREGYDLPELGFVIAPQWQGRGLATEVCQGILAYARESLGFGRVQALVHEENAVSLHLCRKLGFRERPVPAGKPGGCPSCHVEMEQNGQRARFIYMVCEIKKISA